jgi:MFS family permease
MAESPELTATLIQRVNWREMMSNAAVQVVEREHRQPSLRWVVFASSCGALIEWYDFYLYQTMAVFFGAHFFPQSTHQGMLGVLLSMATLAIGFAVRPLGGLLFGSLGDRVGRKTTFLVTMLLMGLTTTCIGFLPTFEHGGYFAPLALLALRVLQGLGVGGELGGASTYVLEHAPRQSRGFYMGMLNVSSPVGTLLSIAVVYLCRTGFGDATFADWGWRVPFLLSGFLVAVSFYLRLQLHETPIFEEMRRNHATAKSPVSELFLQGDNLRRLLRTMFGSTVGQGSIGIVAMVYSLTFMEGILKLNATTASSVFFIAVACALPLYIFFGWLSDRIGRKPLLLTGATSAFVCWIPIYMAMKAASSPPQFWFLVFLNWIQIVFVTMTLAPTIAFVAESFPARVRTTALSTVYNVSAGLMGLVPLIAFSIIASSGNIYLGLTYPIALTFVMVIVNLVFVKETYRREIDAN